MILRITGLEPARLLAIEPKSIASANSAISANDYCPFIIADHLLPVNVFLADMPRLFSLPILGNLLIVVGKALILRNRDCGCVLKVNFSKIGVMMVVMITTITTGPKKLDPKSPTCVPLLATINATSPREIIPTDSD